MCAVLVVLMFCLLFVFAALQANRCPRCSTPLLSTPFQPSRTCPYTGSRSLCPGCGYRPQVTFRG